MPDAVGERLELAEWRRRIAELYAEVRRIARADPPAAHERWRSVRAALYREHPQSPVPPDERERFEPRHFPYEPRWRFECRVLPPDADARVDAAPEAGIAPLPMSVGGPLPFARLGWLEVPFETGTRRLALFWITEYSGGLFLPFRDATNGAATYGGGRYLLDTAKGADLGEGAAPGTIVLDFNFAFQPSCAFDPRWSCPLAPPENRLDLAVEAGERLG